LKNQPTVAIENSAIPPALTPNLNVANVTNETKWAQACLLVLVGLFSFTYNLQISLFEGTEGLYGQITREMVQSGEYIRLTFQGQPYISKPPLFFWMTGGLTQLFGDNELALRLPGALFSLGTMFLTFVLGRTLFSWNVGFWAAFVFATNHVFLWYGRRVLTDSTLTFFMTAALLAWVLGNRKGSSSAWYVVTFLSMALGTMAKGLHGFALPLLLIITYSLWLRDFQALKRWGFWIGGVLFIIVMKVFASLLENSSPWHLAWSPLLVDSFDWDIFGGTGRTPKIPSYLYLIWFDFFPWSVLIPSSLIVLFRKRPFRNDPAVLLILLWFLGYLLVLCLSIWRREPYLMPLVPGFALTIGYYLVALTSGIHVPRWHRIVTGAAFGILTITIISAGFFGPSLLQKKWNVSPDFLPAWYLIGFVILCGFLVWTALQGRFPMMRRGLIGLGLCFSFGMLHIFLPAVDAADSPRLVISKIRELTQHTDSPLYHYGLTQEDLIYYLNADPQIPKIQTSQQVIAQAKKRNTLIVTDQQDGQGLMNHNVLVVKTLEEFPQPRGRKYLLLLIDTDSQEP
jgi:4-amino-4-deoxy-L-arabinose transferase-like glycosyltransferase